nr:MAG TPA: hypothetical protein [Caudoviricetes sp.]
MRQTRRRAGLIAANWLFFLLVLLMGKEREKRSRYETNPPPRGSYRGELVIFFISVTYVLSDGPPRGSPEGLPEGRNEELPARRRGVWTAAGLDFPPGSEASQARPR